MFAVDGPAHLVPALFLAGAVLTGRGTCVARVWGPGSRMGPGEGWGEVLGEYVAIGVELVDRGVEPSGTDLARGD
ncbi:hypothetical protein GCM10010512_18780 [Streptomyces thermoviolaceus subsp. thermoviolaceus]|nr:hypothetical protein GCM10010512_18780 [Streptomyces thermoviolaceus subsp. thermoviolaceus]